MLPSPAASAPKPRDATDPIAHFCMELGLAMHKLGTPAHRLEEVLWQLATGLGAHANFLSTPTSLTASFGRGDLQRTYLIRADQGATHLAKLAALDGLAGDVLRRRCSCQQALLEIERIMSMPRLYSAWAEILAYGAASAAVAAFFKGGTLELCAAGLVGLLQGGWAQLAYRSRQIGRIFEMGAAVTGSVLLAFLSLWWPPFSTPLALLAGLIILMPGMSLTTAMTELSTGNLVSGTSRLVGVGMTFLKLGFGAALGNHVARALGAPIFSGPVVSLELPEPLVIVFAAAALSVILQAAKQDVFAIFTVSLAGLFGQNLGALWFGPGLSPMVAAGAVTFLSNARERRFGRATSITQVPAILLLVPGSVGFRSVSQLLEHDLHRGIETALNMTLSAAALVAGTLLAGMLLPPRKLV